MIRFYHLILIFTLSTFCVYSAGFQLNDHNARSVAMGFSTVANISDPSANYYNPAGITFDSSMLSISAGASYILPKSKFTGIETLNEEVTTNAETWNFLIPNIYASYRTPVSGLSVGAGFFCPFGLGTKWPDNWVGRFSTIKTYLQNFEINPNLAYKFEILEMPVSVAVGFGYVISNVEMTKKISTFSPEPLFTLKGNGKGTTFNAGILLQPLKSLKIGAAYRHNIEIDYDGDVTYENISGLESMFVAGKGTTKIKYPNDFRLGVAYNLVNNLWIEAGMNYTGWSSYDTLKIHLDKQPGNPTSPYDVSYPRLYKDNYAFRLGGEYKYDKKLSIRLGFYYDQMPVDSKYVEPLLPEGNRYAGSIGFGYKVIDKFSVDIAYLGIFAQQVHVVGDPDLFDGIYNSYADVFSLSLNFNF